MSFRGYELSGSYAGFADRPAHADARAISDDLIRAYREGQLDRVEIVYNSYLSPLTQRVTQERLLPLSQATIAGEDEQAEEQARDADGRSSMAAASPPRWTTSRSRRRSSGDSCPTTWSCPSIVRWWSPPRASSARR